MLAIKKIKNVGTPQANESDKAANVGFVVKEINHSNQNLTKQYKAYMAQSHLVSSHQTKAFKHLFDADESSSKYNIIVLGIPNFNESSQQNIVLAFKKTVGVLITDQGLDLIFTLLLLEHIQLFSSIIHQK